MRKTLLIVATSLLAHLVAYSQKNIADSTNLLPPSVTTLTNYAAQSLTQKNWTVAENSAQKALSIATERGDKEGIATSYSLLGQVAEARSDFKNAMNWHIEALKIFDALGNKAQIAAEKTHIGSIFFKQNDRETALKNYQSALELLQNAQKPDEKRHLAALRFHFGDVFLAQKIYGKAIAEYEQALSLWQETQDLQKAAAIANHLGKVSIDLGNYDAATTYLNAALDLHRALDDPKSAGDDMVQIANIQMATNDVASATETLQNAMNVYQAANATLGLANVWAKIAKIQLQQNNRAEGVRSLDKSAALLRGVSAQIGVPELYQSLATSFAQLGEFPKAFELQKLYAESKENVSNLEKTAALFDLTAKYESEFAVKEKTRQITNLEKQKSTERKILFLAIGLFLLAGALAFLIYKNYEIKKADNERLTQLNEKIQAQHESLVQKTAEITRQNDVIAAQNDALLDKNASLDQLNKRLVGEIAERETLQSSLFSKDHFLANVSQEMRIPLNTLVETTHQLLQDKPRADQRESIVKLQFAANNILVLINDILDFSHIEAGKLTLNNLDFSLHSTLENIQKTFIKETQKVFQVNITKEVQPILHGDSARLTQILTYLTNHLQNRIGQESSLTLNVTKAEQTKEDFVLRMELHASGVSGSEFVTFFEKLGKRAHIGTDSDGLNRSEMELLLAKRLIELQNGMLTLHPELEEAIVIEILLPYKLTAATLAMAAEGRETARTTRSGLIGNETWRKELLKGKRILVVDDSKINQSLVIGMLRKHEVFFTTADDGLEALEIIDNQDFDLILMDLQMPRMDGYRAVAEIRRMNKPQKSQVPIIAFTASKFVNKTEKAQLFGMSDHIGKPFSREELFEKICAVLTQDNLKDEEIMPNASA